MEVCFLGVEDFETSEFAKVVHLEVKGVEIIECGAGKFVEFCGLLKEMRSRFQQLKDRVC